MAISYEAWYVPVRFLLFVHYALDHNNKCWFVVFHLCRFLRQLNLRIPSPDLLIHFQKLRGIHRFPFAFPGGQTPVLRHFRTTIKKARSSFSFVKNKVNKVFFESLEDLTVSISTKDSKPKEQKSEYVLLTKAERSVICVL